MFEEERVFGDNIEPANIERVVDLGNCCIQSRSKPVEFLILLNDRAQSCGHMSAIVNKKPFAEVAAGIIRSAAMVGPQRCTIQHVRELIGMIIDIGEQAASKHIAPLEIVPA